MQSLIDDDERSERIANNSFEFYRHWLSPASIDCYWRRLFMRWAEVQNFEPVLKSNMVSFNSFMCVPIIILFFFPSVSRLTLS